MKKILIKHTSGPWQIANEDNGSMEINIGETTATVCRWDKNTGEYMISRDEMNANAILIANSPNLLEKCREAIGILDEIEDHNGMIQDVIDMLDDAVIKCLHYRELTMDDIV